MPFIISFIYLMAPFALFSVGWMKAQFWIPIILILFISFIYATRNISDNYYFVSKNDLSKLIVALGIIAIWVYFSGIGKFVFQNEDHFTRNAIFEIMINYDWPIINHQTTGELPGNPQSTSLIYYLGFWIPAAVVGKMFGMTAANIFLYLWAVFGVFLTYYFICVKQNHVSLLPLVIMIMFSGLDIIGTWLTGIDLSTISNDFHLEWWIPPYQYSSMTTQLFWVFNQAIPAWLGTILILLQKNNRSLILILSCCLLTSTFPFVGLIPIVLYQILFLRKNAIDRKTWILDLFSFQNVLGGGVIGIFSFLYLKSNVASGQFMKQSCYGPTYTNSILKLILFISCEFMVYTIVLFKYKKNDYLFYIINILLTIIPLFRIGEGADFCMRASIPSLFILMLFVIEVFTSHETDKKTKTLLLLILCVGSITPLHEIIRTCSNTITCLNQGLPVYTGTRDYINIFNTEYLSGGIDNSIFFNHIIK